MYPTAVADDAADTARLNEDVLVSLRPPVSMPESPGASDQDFLFNGPFGLLPFSRSLIQPPQALVEPPAADLQEIPAKPPALPPSQVPFRKEEKTRRRTDTPQSKLALTSGGRALGSVSVAMTEANIVAVDAKELQQQLAPLLDETTRLLLSQFERGVVSINQLRAIGIFAEVDPVALTLDIALASNAERFLAFDAGARDGSGRTILAVPSSPATGPAVFSSASPDFVGAETVINTALSTGSGKLRGPGDRNLDRGEAALSFDDFASSGTLANLLANTEPAPAHRSGPRRMATTPEGVEPVAFYTSDSRPPPSTSRALPSRMETFQRNQARTVSIELMANYRGRPIGSLVVDTTLTEVVALDAEQLSKALSPLVDQAISQQLDAAGSGPVSKEQLRAMGVRAELDPKTLTLDIDAPPRQDDRPLQLNLGGRDAPEGTITAEPARLAAGLTSTFLYNQDFENPDNSTLSAALTGFMNAGGPTGLNLDYGGILTFDDGTGESGFEADRTILFIDRPDQALRFEAGTLYTPLSTLAGEGDFLGVGVTKSYRQLQPTRVLRPLGQRSFLLNRASEVTVLLDGQVISQFDAPAGAVELNDIPLANASNRVSIVVEDEFGRRETESFSIASDVLLLQPGISEYAAGLGQTRDRSQNGYSYESDLIALGNYQYGVTPGLTVGAYGYASDGHAIGGGQSVFSVFDGIAQVDVGYSDSDTAGSGIASSVNYRWNSPPSAKRAHSFAVAFDYRDRAFTPAGSQFGTGIKFDASAFYETQVSDKLRVNFAGSYSEDYFSNEPTHSLAIGSSYQLGQFFLGAGARIGSVAGREEETSAFFTLTRRLGSRGSVNARYDTENNRSSLRYRMPSANEVGNLGFQADYNHSDTDDTLRGAADYTANRYRARLALSHSERAAPMDNSSTMTARFQSGIAFADGKIGLGRDPGRGFVMVSRHESLSDSTVEIRSRGRQGLRANSGVFGPAVSQVSSPFVPTTTLVDVIDAPMGYNVGEGSYYSVPGARSGISITVGADDFRSVVATFTAYGEPVSVSAGKVTNLETGASQLTFTNRSGRALISNLVPGTYRVEFAATMMAFEFEVEAGDEAFANLGTVDLSKGTTQ